MGKRSAQRFGKDQFQDIDRDLLAQIELQHSLGCYFIAGYGIQMVCNCLGFDVDMVLERYQPNKAVFNIITGQFRPQGLLGCGLCTGKDDTC